MIPIYSKFRNCCYNARMLTLCLAAKYCESANPNTTTLVSAINATSVDGCIVWVMLECSKYVRTSVALLRRGTCAPLFESLEKRGMFDYYITLGGKPVTRTTLVSDLTIDHNAQFSACARMRGGSDRIDPTQYFETPKYHGQSADQWVVAHQKSELRSDFLTERQAKKTRAKLRKFELQALDYELDLQGSLKKIIDPEVMSLIEDLSILCLQFLRASSNTDRLIAAMSFYKARAGSSIVYGMAGAVSDVFNDFFGPELQAEETWLEGVTNFRELLDNWSAICTSSLVQRFMKAYKFAVALGVFSMIGIKIDKDMIAACKRESGFELGGASFIYSIVDAISLLLQRGLMFMASGEWQTLFHGPKSYGKWFDQCVKVRRESNFVGNLEAVGTNYHSFTADVASAIETGESILRFGERTTGIEAKNIKMLLNEMKMIQANLFTYNEAQQSRRPPFSLLVCSGSSLAKSTFVDMLFKFMGQVWKLEASDAFKYTRNSAEPFWSGWNSSKWFILLDDIAYINPNSPVQDISLTEMISLVNDVPLVPNQAALEDKGKNPVRARAVVATTNVKDLNAHAHFSCPLAVQRRLPFVINLAPKKQYAREDSPNMIDPLKLPPITDDWPDFWLISVERVVDAGEGRARHEVLECFGNVNDFLDWLRITMHEFDAVQAKAAAGCSAMADFKLCDLCNRVKCVCKQLQAHRSRDLPKGVNLGDNFTLVDSENGITYHEDFEYLPKDGYNYMCTQITLKGGKVLYKRVVPVLVEQRSISDTRLESRAEYAEILAEIVRRQSLAASEGVYKYTSLVVSAFVELYSKSRLVRRLADAALDWKVCRWLVLWLCNKFLNIGESSRAMCVKLGDIVYRAYMTPRWKIVLAGLTVAAGSILVFKGYRMMTARKEAEKPETPAVDSPLEPEAPEAPAAECQALRKPANQDIFEKTEKENVWKRDDFEVCSIDKTPSNVNYKTLSFDHLTTLICKNVARIKVSNGVRAREGNAFCVGGHLWMTNNHTVHASGDLEVSLAVTPDFPGVSQNVTVKMRQTEFFRLPQSDVVFFEITALSPKKDLRQLVRKPTLHLRGKGFYVGYSKERLRRRVQVAAVQLDSTYVEELDLYLPAWRGVTGEPTVVGDCGMPLVTYGEPVVAIVGIHMLGNANCDIWATAIDSEMVGKAVAHFARPIVQCSYPVLDAPSVQKSLVALHQKSPLRWIEHGTVTVFGSFAGFTHTARSKVRPTLLGDTIIAERGWVVDAHAPKLQDWRPWRHALLDITGQKYGAVDPVKLRQCGQSFIKDVLDQLPHSVLEQIQVLDDVATVNGIPGVKFIDKMNFKSSMGEPYRKPKKAYLSGEIGEVEFSAEVKDRINSIKERYDRLERTHPVFCGQTKDEARAWAKVIDGKIRIFTAAPADWSFVVRQYLLPMVKVIQDHPFVFNASPGCAAQSAEWEQYYDYLTEFGADRLVAGDYGKFDKRMEASVILEAFRIVAEIMRAAGWSEEDLAPVFCIAEDTAYNTVNFGGDLVEFVGSNPSGHPLTVIINCIANVLYMRYCYLELNPAEGSAMEKLANFRQTVNLLTYGDDNVMNVHPTCDWFNHTAIQGVLASIGVEYTMADKHSVSRPFIHIREVSYLKRAWRWDEDIGAVVCPLEEASIHKMLTVCLPSDEESREFHMASVMVSAANEWFWHGKHRFEAERAWLIKLAADAGISRELQVKKMPSWEELFARYWDASKGVTTKRSRGCSGVHPRDIVA